MEIKENSTNQENKKYLSDNCPEIYAIQILGGQWALAICCILLEGRLRFSDLGRRIPNITERMLALQLRKMEKNGLVAREVFPETPQRVEYFLTDSGRQLKEIVTLLNKWGTQHMEQCPEKEG